MSDTPSPATPCAEPAALSTLLRQLPQHLLLRVLRALPKVKGIDRTPACERTLTAAELLGWMPLALHNSVVDTCMTVPCGSSGLCSLQVVGGPDELNAVAPHAVRLGDRIMAFQACLGGALPGAVLSGALPQLVMLKRLNLLRVAWLPDGAAQLSRLLDALPQLEWLGIQYSDLDDAGSCAVLHACLRMPSLRELHMSGFAVTGSSAYPGMLSQLTQLTRISFRAIRCSLMAMLVKIVRALASLPRLEQLEWTGNTATRAAAVLDATIKLITEAPVLKVRCRCMFRTMP
jgi:hypothetical protein